MFKLLAETILGISGIASVGIIVYCAKKMGNICENIFDIVDRDRNPNMKETKDMEG